MLEEHSGVQSSWSRVGEGQVEQMGSEQELSGGSQIMEDP